MNELNYRISDFGARSGNPSAVNELTESFAADFREGIDINLGVGYVNDKTIPSDEIREAYRQIISEPEKYRNTLNYGGAVGSPVLRQSLKNYYLRNNIGRLNPQDWNKLQVLIGAVGATSILEAFTDIMPAGIVITADPYYYIYTDTLERKGYTILSIPEEPDGINIKLLKKKLDRIDLNDISFFYIVTVNNPSTVILSNPKRKELCTLVEEISLKQNRLIPLLFDKAYEDIIHDKNTEKPISGLKHNFLGNVFEIGTLSKAISPALRIGYLISKQNSLLPLLIQKTSDIGFSAPLINQNISSWLLDNTIELQLNKVNEAYRKKSQKIKELLETKCGKHIKNYEGGKAAFYFFITLNNIETHKESNFFKFLSRQTGKNEIDGYPDKKPRLVYIPGEICSKTDVAKYQFRIAFGFEPMEELERAIQLIADACEYAAKLY